MIKLRSKKKEAIFVSYPLNEDENMLAIANEHGLQVKRLEEGLIKPLLKISKMRYKKYASYTVARDGRNILVGEITRKGTRLITIVRPI